MEGEEVEDEGIVSTEPWIVLSDFERDEAASVSPRPRKRKASKSKKRSDRMASTAISGVGEEWTAFTPGIFYRPNNSSQRALSLKITGGGRVYFRGKAVAELESGEVEIGGYKMVTPGEKISIFSSRSSSLLFIQGSPTTTATLLLHSYESRWSLGFRSTAHDGETLLGPLVHLHAAAPTADDNPLPTPSMKHFLRHFGFQFIPEKLYPNYKLMRIPEEWEGLSRKGSKRIGVFGGKGAGKSTFCRWLINRSLSEGGNGVLYVELDPGQTELTPPGVLSIHRLKQPLIGPNFTHLRTPLFAVPLGAIDVAPVALDYLQRVMQLRERLEELEGNESFRCVVNTMGFSTGLGVPLAVAVIRILDLDSVVQLEWEGGKGGFPFHLDYDTVKGYEGAQFLLPQMKKSYQKLYSKYSNGMKRYRWNSFKSEGNGLEGGRSGGGGGGNPRTQRENMIISYFGEHLFGPLDDTVLPNHRLNLNTITIGIMDDGAGIMEWERIRKFLLGNLILLCKLPEQTLLDNVKYLEGSSSSVFPFTTKTFLLSLSSLDNLVYIGYGIGRSYNRETSELYILSPIDNVDMVQVNCIVNYKGCALPFPLVKGGRGGGSRSMEESTKKIFIPGKQSTHKVLDDL